MGKEVSLNCDLPANLVAVYATLTPNMTSVDWLNSVIIFAQACVRRNDALHIRTEIATPICMQS